MRVLLSCPNSDLSLVGYDWDKGEIFWGCPKEVVQACSVCYDGECLLLASHNSVFCLGPSRRRQFELPPPGPNRAHSVRRLGEGLAVVDTGNTRVIQFTRKGELCGVLNPLEGLGRVPNDALHLNDFVETPYGVVASCFDYRPWRLAERRTSREEGRGGGYGLLLNLTGHRGCGVGRVVGCGFAQPHSLQCHDGVLSLCSSGRGIFHLCEFDGEGLVHRRRDYAVTRNMFLRGAWKMGRGEWLLGGSSIRLADKTYSGPMELYRLDETSGAVETRSLGRIGEIYDILPWDDDVLRPILAGHFRGV